MALRLAPLLLLAALAPMQCTRAPDPDAKRDESADDGLYALAQDFRAKGNQAAYEATLRFLLVRYPKSPRAGRARDELASRAAAPAASP